MARHLVSVFIALFFFLRCSIAIVSWRIYVWQQHLISPMGALFGKIAIRHERKQKRMLLGRRARSSSVLWKYIYTAGGFLILEWNETFSDWNPMKWKWNRRIELVFSLKRGPKILLRRRDVLRLPMSQFLSLNTKAIERKTWFSFGRLMRS